MIRLGLIGKNISYSFSKKYFEQKFNSLLLSNYFYDIFDLHNIEEVERVFQIRNLRGFNVTIPYKQKIISYLDELSDEAREIGAVNTVLVRDEKRIGYNTDIFGFEQSLKSGWNEKHTSALILGNGGVAQAVKYVLKKYSIPYTIVSRSGELKLNQITQKLINTHLLIVQCTPVGTFPNIESCLDFPFHFLTKEHFVIDLIYNPAQTMFLEMSKKYGAKGMNGLLMLEQQAEKAWQIWN